LRPAASSPFPLAGLALVAAAVVAYHGSFAIPFFFDDHAAITHNASIRDLARLDRVLLPPADGSGMAGRPLVNLSLALNYAAGGTAPAGYHAVNLLVHAACGLLLFGLVRRTLLLPGLRPRFGGAAAALGFFSALLWLLHPLQTEAVSCVIQRTELLVGVWYLLTLYAVLRGATDTNRTGWNRLAVVACTLGMLSKEVMVTAPVLVLFYDRTFLAGSFRSAWTARHRLYLGLAATWLVLAALLWQMGGARGTAAGFGLGITWWSYALKQCEAIVRYLVLAVWPAPLVIDYGTAVVAGPAAVAPHLAIVSALALATLAGLRWRPAAGFLGWWFCGILAPSSSVVPLVAQTMAEHRMYLPLAAIVVAAVVAGHRLAGRKFVTAATLVAVALAGVTIARNRLLQDEVGLWTQTIAQVPDNARAHASLGLALYERGRAAGAVPHFQRALALAPHDAATEQNLGNALLQLGRPDEAEAAYRRAVALAPSFAAGYNNLGVVRLERGDHAGALAAFESALRLEPEHVGAHRNLGRLRFAQGLFAAAIPHYAAVLRAQPDSPDAHYDLGLVLARTGDIDGAARHFGAALQLRPNAASFLNCARFLSESGRVPAAIAALEQALRLRPDLAEARRELERLRGLPATRP